MKREHNINLNWLATGEGEMFATTIEDSGLDSDKFTEEQNLFERLQSEIERLQKEVSRLTSENDLCSDLVQSKNRIIENLEAQFSKI